MKMKKIESQHALQLAGASRLPGNHTVDLRCYKYHTMKKSITLLFAVGTLALAGCSTMHQESKWEYKTVEAREGQQDALIAQDGW